MTSDELKNHIVGALIVALSVEGKRGAQSVATAIDELIQYRINEALNEAQPGHRFEMGEKVKVLTGYHAMKVGIIAKKGNGLYGVRFDGDKQDYSFHPLDLARVMPQPAFAVGTRVRVAISKWSFPVGSVGTITRWDENYRTIAYVEVSGEGEAPFSVDALEPVVLPDDILAQLDHADAEAYNDIKRYYGLTEEKIAELRTVEPLPAEPAALPEGVTRVPNKFFLESQEDMQAWVEARTRGEFVFVENEEGKFPVAVRFDRSTALALRDWLNYHLKESEAQS